MKFKKNCIDLSFKGNSQSIDHLFRGRIGPTPSLSVVNFETSLRCNNNQQFLQKEKNWSTLPKKDRHGFFLLFF